MFLAKILGAQDFLRLFVFFAFNALLNRIDLEKEIIMN